MLQSGESRNSAFTSCITRLIRTKEPFGRNPRHYLFAEKQTGDVYREWFDAGAHRYLLRIETSNRSYITGFTPSDSDHDFDCRVNLPQVAWPQATRTGTGVMIGQAVSDG
ncbi:MAG: hypothetical protein R2744_02620 [Bacteroidales bacterium]